MEMSKALYLRVVGLVCMASVLAAAPAGDDPLVADAAMRGDLDTVRSLLDRGADVNVAQGDGMTALHWAAERGDLDMVEVLLEAGANSRAGTRIGHYTPLHLAGTVGHGAVVEALLRRGADPEATNANGTTPLHLAARGGSVDAVAALLDHGADVNAREFRWGQTPLMFAATFNRVDAMKVLIKRSAGLDIASQVVDLPAREAVDRLAQRRRNEMLQAFRAEAAPDEQATWAPSPSQVQTAIRAAREVQESLNSAEEAGEEINTRYSDLVGVQGGLTALHHAARQGNEAAARALIDAGADINKVSGDGSSPLQIATMNGRFDLAMLLLEGGADPNVATDAGGTPLFAAINVQWAPVVRYPQPRAQDQQKVAYLELMEALLEAGADPNLRTNKDIWYVQYNYCCAQNVDGATPFWRAAYALDGAAMRLLVRYGADPNIPTRAQEFRWGGNTVGVPLDEDPSGLPPVPVGGPGFFPIHAASGLGYGLDNEGNSHRHVPGGWLPAVRYLVEELGADVNAVDYLGYNAVHNAASRGDVELIGYLVEKGADVTAVSRRGQTTADMANSPSTRAPIPVYPEAIELLESLGSKNNHNCNAC
jgi:ankyrin repeat protein